MRGIVDMISIWFWRKYSNKPMHLFGAAVMIFSFVGFMILVWMGIEKIFFNASIAQRNWPLIGVFFVLVGIQLFVFGLLADILLKIYYKNRNAMNYNIKEIINQ